MGPGRDRTRDPWICSQTRICCQTRYRLRYLLERRQPSHSLNRGSMSILSISSGIVQQNKLHFESMAAFTIEKEETRK